MPSIQATVQSPFDSLALSPALLAVVRELGYAAPTPIQAESIPLLLAGKDLIGQSETGSGKTAAFALPILQGLVLEPTGAPNPLQALILCPTRELCAQVAREVRKLGRRHPGLQVLELAGGQPVKPQSSALERGVHVAVGTPGRVLDHLKRGSLVTAAIQTVVLDEADRMLDMGFYAEMEDILRQLPRSRQTVLFSATFPERIEAISKSHQRQAVRVTIAEQPAEAEIRIRQAMVWAERDDKLDALVGLLDRYPHESALIFCNFKATVTELTRTLAAAGLSVDCLHGDLEQFHRDQVLAKFRNQSVRVLIATDVAGRGIDVEKLDLVINYELPDKPEIYLHRIGRTGRAGQVGQAVCLAGKRDSGKLRAIEELTGADLEVLATDRRAPPLSALAREARMDTILISGGRKDKVRPADILGALTGESGALQGADVGKIEIHDRLSYVAVSKRVSRHAVQCLSRGRIKKKRYKATLV